MLSSSTASTRDGNIFFGSAHVGDSKQLTWKDLSLHHWPYLSFNDGLKFAASLVLDNILR